MPKTKRASLNEDLMVEVTFTTTASLHKDDDGENFLHSIDGKIVIRDVELETEKRAGRLQAYLIQFLEAQCHGVSATILGDHQTHQVRRYWNELFDFDEFKSEIQEEWQTEGCDVLAIDSLQILNRFEGQGIRLAALARTIDLFGRNCDLVACFPDEMHSPFDWEKPKPPRIDKTDLKAAITKDCLAAGFRPLGDSGLYLLNPTLQRADVLLEVDHVFTMT